MKTTMSNPGQTARYNSSVRRISAEACWLFTEQTALIEIEKVGSHGLDFFRVAFTGLLGDRLLRLVRVFEESVQVASFWYLVRCNPRCVEQAIVGAGGSLKQLKKFSRQLKLIRDRTFVHIDKDAVFDPQQIYTQAGILNSEVDAAIRVLWGAMQSVHHFTFGKPFPHDSYSGADIGGFRDASSSRYPLEHSTARSDAPT